MKTEKCVDNPPSVRARAKQANTAWRRRRKKEEGQSKAIYVWTC